MYNTIKIPAYNMLLYYISHNYKDLLNKKKTKLVKQNSNDITLQKLKRIELMIRYRTTTQKPLKKLIETTKCGTITHWENVQANTRIAFTIDS